MATSVTTLLSRVAASDGLQKSFWPVLVSAAGTVVFPLRLSSPHFSLAVRQF
jgi:hypothetical protein